MAIVPRMELNVSWRASELKALALAAVHDVRLAVDRSRLAIARSRKLLSHHRPYPFGESDDRTEG